jgi:hypothetical protein
MSCIATENTDPGRSGHGIENVQGMKETAVRFPIAPVGPEIPGFEIAVRKG